MSETGYGHLTDAQLDDLLRLGRKAQDCQGGLALMGLVLVDERAPTFLRSLAAQMLQLIELRHREKAKFDASMKPEGSDDVPDNG